MLYLSLCFFFFFFFPLNIVAVAATTPAYTATVYILLNCGASSNLTDNNTRVWEGDLRTSKYSPPNAQSSPFNASEQQQQRRHSSSSVNQVPYLTARVFQSPFAYTFPLPTGPKFLRLYFYPTTYSTTFNTTQSFFSVTANDYTLLSNFSAFLNSPSSSSNPSFFKEFLINIDQNQRLVLTFSPNQNSFAFINGIEIVSIPDGLDFFDQQTGDLIISNDTALENLYRLNVGGSNIQVQDDSGGMFRAWYQDDNYLVFGNTTAHAAAAADDVWINYTTKTPPYSAPERVYTTSRTIANNSNRLDWLFPVDSGFYYLLRLHFCEFQLEVNRLNERVFTVQVDNRTVESEADVIAWTGGNDVPIWRNYLAWWINNDDGGRGKRNMRLSLFPNMETRPLYANALLNGLEIFKLSDPGRSLAAPNPDFISESSSPGVTVMKKNRKGSSVIIYSVIGSLIGVFALIATISLLIFRKVKDSRARKATRSSCAVQLPSDLCRYFLLKEIRLATNNFDDSFVIGKGGFGNVYKGCIDNDVVAIKRLNSSSNQGVREFLTEIDLLSKLRHLHLVSLLGYCNENGEMILVYDYMAHGTLREHLYNSENSPLTWMQRLQICIGAAKGLHYLHTSLKQTVIHRDVKSTNILLDEKWVAKVSDFGLSSVCPTGESHTHVSTTVKGSFGYIDPEYYKRQQLTHKSDVYSFGVVLFEVLSARPAVIPSLQVNLAEWAKLCCKRGILEQIIEHNLHGKIAPECLRKFLETALTCVMDRGIKRPTMNDVVWSLEVAMRLQEEAEKKSMTGNSSFPLPMNIVGVEAKTMDIDEEIFSGSNNRNLSTSNCDKSNAEDIFTEVLNPLGR